MDQGLYGKLAKKTENAVGREWAKGSRPAQKKIPD